ncbi:MAG: diaminopimelate decarboxylase [Candidatus Omnitrophica bacterium]|nr:diaminopimelate decarboxylase [Candidatus Omnitrophota bacterium]
MHLFNFKNNELHAENVPVRDIVKKVGSPVYIYSLGTFLHHYKRLKSAFAPVDNLICFSVKSNSNLTVLKTLIKAGSGLDIVSGGELYRALKVGADPKKIVFASVGKSDEEIAAAISAGILSFNVESEEELDAINRVASRLKRRQNISLRINPDVQPKTHHYITTGSKGNKFGIDMETAFRLYTDASRYPFLKFSGVHLHIGSQITESTPFVKALNRASAFIARLRKKGVVINTMNIGGGLGIIYSNEQPQTAAEYAKAVLPILKKLKVRVILEPGRFISGNSGILVTKVLFWKSSPTKTFAIVDAGMNDLLRPSIYSAYHEIVTVLKPSRSAKILPEVDIVGPICESGDFLGKGRKLPKLEAGDLLAVMSAGAYGYVMSSNYNSRPRVAEVVVRGSKFAVARRRETMEDVLRGEKIVNV